MKNSCHPRAAGDLIQLMCVSFILSGCASDPGKFDIKNDQPVIQIPNN